MMIGKFHKLIQSRLLWAVFLVVIVFSFVIWGMQLPGERDRRTSEAAPGLMDGQPVPPEEFQAASLHTYAGILLAYGPDIPFTAELRERLREAAWERLSLLRLADRLGLQATDDQVAQAIRSQPVFQIEGRFDSTLYRTQIAGLLEGLGVSLRFFEEHVRQELVLEQLRALTFDTVLIPPSDLDQMLSTITDRFDLAWVRVTPGLEEEDAVIPEDELRAAFEQHVERYRLPERLEVRLVRFPADPEADDLPDPDEYDLQDYYAEHAHRFRSRSAPDEDGTMPAERLRPFEDVRPEVLTAMRHEASRLRALREAERFSERIAPRMPGQTATPFDEAASEIGIEPEPHGPWAASDSPAETGVSPAVLRAAFDLRPDEGVTRAVADGSDAVVLEVTRRHPARLPSLEEVRPRAESEVRRRRVRDELQDRVRSLREAAEAEGGLHAAAEGAGLEIRTVEGFHAAEQDEREDGGLPFDAFFHGVLHLERGELSDPLPDGAGALLLVEVLDRTSAPGPEREALRPDILEMLTHERSRRLFQTLQAHLLDGSRFTDLRPLREALDDSEFDD